MDRTAGRRRIAALGLAIALSVVAMTPASSEGGRSAGPQGPVPEPMSIASPPSTVPPGGAALASPLAGAAFDGSNVIKPLPAEAVRELESSGTKVIENQDGLIVVELLDDRGERVRIAALNEHTDRGTDVIGLAFLDDTEIAELEAMQSSATGLFGPATALGHFKDQSHYHYFYNCSYVYQQGGTYGITWYMCPNDTYWDRVLGTAIGTVLGCCATYPLLRLLGGMLVLANQYFFYNADGSLRGSMSDYRVACGWLLWNNISNHWMYYYCLGSANYGYGWDDYWDRYFDLTP